MPRPWARHPPPSGIRPIFFTSTWTLGSELDVILALGAAHGQEQLLAALGRAVAFQRFRAADVWSILAAGTSIPTPVAPGGALVVDLPVAGTRSLADYNLAAITGHTAVAATGVTP